MKIISSKINMQECVRKINGSDQDQESSICTSSLSLSVISIATPSSTSFEMILTVVFESSEMISPNLNKRIYI